VDGYKAKYVVAGYGIAARGEGVVDFLQIVADKQRLLVFLIELFNQSVDMRIKLIVVYAVGRPFGNNEIAQILQIDLTLGHAVEKILRRSEFKEGSQFVEVFGAVRNFKRLQLSFQNFLAIFGNSSFFFFKRRF